MHFYHLSPRVYDIARIFYPLALLLQIVYEAITLQQQKRKHEYDCYYYDPSLAA